MPKDLDKELKRRRVEKELKELYRIRFEMEKLANRGSKCDKENIKLVDRGLDSARKILRELDA